MLRVHVQQNRVHILLGPAGHLTVQFDRRMHDLDHPDEELVAGTGLGELFDLRVRQEHWITLCYTVPAPPHTIRRPGVSEGDRQPERPSRWGQTSHHVDAR